MSTRTYTPGYFWTKFAFFMLGVAIIAAGIASIAHPIRLLFVGVAPKGRAEVVAVIAERPGEAPRVITSKDEVQPDSPRVRKTIFRYRAAYVTPEGKKAEGLLSIAFKAKPNVNIGDKFYVRYDPDDTREYKELACVTEYSTWTFGAFLIIAGLFQAFVQGVYLLYSRKPIPIPEDTPVEETPVLK